VNHAVTKALVFFAVGDAALRSRSREMHRIRGRVEVTPFAATFLLLGAFSLTGTPPFSVFVSELLVLRAGISGGRLLASVLFVGSLAVIFGGIIHHIGGMAFGEPRRRLLEKEGGRGESAWSIAGMMVLAVPMVVLGLCIPGPLDGMLSRAAAIVLTGGRP
jgi:hydrogenase-4 component F